MDLVTREANLHQALSQQLPQKLDPQYYNALYDIAFLSGRRNHGLHWYAYDSKRSFNKNVISMDEIEVATKKQSAVSL